MVVLACDGHCARELFVRRSGILQGSHCVIFNTDSCFRELARMEILSGASQNRIPLPAIRWIVATSRDCPLDAACRYDRHGSVWILLSCKMPLVASVESQFRPYFEASCEYVLYVPCSGKHPVCARWEDEPALAVLQRHQSLEASVSFE